VNFGVHLANGGVWASRDTIVPLGVRADELGFDSVWVSDHVVLPSRIESTYPYGPPGTFTPETSQNFWEPFAVLAFIAGRTQRVKLGTSVLVVPQRQPLVVAKQWATLDALSGGRTILGIGAGWMREEFEALGVDTFERRGAATDEAVRLYRAVWTQEGDVSFNGDVYQFSPLRAVPKPAQKAGPPIWVGGHGRRSIRRAAELGDGWHAVRIDLEDLRTAVTTLHEMLERYGRQPQDVLVSVVVNAHAPGTGPQGVPRDYDLVGRAEQMAEKVHAYQAAGAQYVVINTWPRQSAATMLESLEFFASEVRPLVQ
jgi:probable F420-dependent oxidoreductase